MKKIIPTLLAAFMAVTLPQQVAAQSVHCGSYTDMLAAFADQGTVYRFNTEGPNHSLVRIYEHVATGRGIAVKVYESEDLACVEAAGFGYSALVDRLSISVAKN